MSLDTSPMGVLCSRAMEQISEQFGENAFVRTVALVVEVDSGPRTHVLVACTDDRAWAQIAFLDQGIVALEDQLTAACDESE